MDRPGHGVDPLDQQAAGFPGVCDRDHLTDADPQGGTDQESVTRLEAGPHAVPGHLDPAEAAQVVGRVKKLTNH